MDERRVMTLWRQAGLPEYFLGNGGTNVRLVAFAQMVATERHEQLEAENAALKREAHTWSKAAEHYAKPLQPLDPLDVEELWDVANADPYADEVHHEFARLIQRKLGIGG